MPWMGKLFEKEKDPSTLKRTAGGIAGGVAGATIRTDGWKGYDGLEKAGTLNVVPCSGFIRVKR